MTTTSKLERACKAGRTALDRLPHVNSTRCLARLRRVADKLRGWKVNSHVREFSSELNRRLQLLV